MADDELEDTIDDESPADDTPGDDSPPPAAEPEAAPADDAPGDDSPGVDVAELMLALADHGVILPEDTNEANFLDRLRVALIAKKGALPGAGQQQPGGNQFGNDMGDTIVADPQIATMSLAQRNAIKFAEQTHRKGIEQRLHRLTETGRCTPAERDAQLQKLKTVRLSLTSEGKPADNKVTDWIANRAALPKGAVWEPRERLRRMSARAVPQPEPKTFATDPNSAAAMSEKDIDSAAKTLL